jgi:hypothetical protein
MENYLSADFLKEQTRLSLDRIHREKYASNEEIDAFLKSVEENALFKQEIRNDILRAVTQGQYQVHILLNVPLRILRGLGTFRVGKSFQMYQLIVDWFVRFFKTIAEVNMAAQVRGLDEEGPLTPGISFWLKWDV